MEPETAVAPKSKKGLYIVIAIVVIIILAMLVRKSGEKIAGVDVDRNMDGSVTYSNEEGSVNMGGNKLPENWPSDAPKYPNASIQYSGSSNPQTGEAGAMVAFTTSDSPEVVADFYTKELKAQGWVLEQTATIGGSTILAAKKDTRTFGVSITDGGKGGVSVTVGVGIPNTK